MKHRDCRFSKGCTIPFFCALFPPGRMVFAEDPCHARLCAPVFSLTNCAVVWWVLSNRDTTLLSVQWNQEWAGPLLQRWHVMQGRVMTGCCVLLFGVRARPPQWLHYLLATLPCTNHLALLTLTFIYSKVHTISIYVHGGNNKKVLSSETYRIYVLGHRDVGLCNLQLYHSF